jgi:nicotinamidase-related amidase
MTDALFDKELNATLEAAFERARQIYAKRGFQRRIGFGSRPALINVDLANAWTRPGNPFTCEEMDDRVMPNVQKLLAAFRRNALPVVHITTAYQITDMDTPYTDMGLWQKKIPIEVVRMDQPELWAIDSRIEPIAGEQVLLKKRASAFHGTYLAGYLRAAGVDTIIVTGVTASACVRETVCDGIADGFRTIIARECVGDRIPGAVAWNLFDLDAKFGDVEPTDSCIAYLDGLNAMRAAAE